MFRQKGNNLTDKKAIFIKCSGKRAITLPTKRHNYFETNGKRSLRGVPPVNVHISKTDSSTWRWSRIGNNKTMFSELLIHGGIKGLRCLLKPPSLMGNSASCPIRCPDAGVLSCVTEQDIDETDRYLSPGCKLSYAQDNCGCAIDVLETVSCTK